MPECILLQIGQCGNQIGSRFWQKASKLNSYYSLTLYQSFKLSLIFQEEEHSGLYDESMATFFTNEVAGRRTRASGCPVGCLKARGLKIDMEPSIIKYTLVNVRRGWKKGWTI
jgi:Tubulin/FtsZ family, GTPase domain